MIFLITGAYAGLLILLIRVGVFKKWAGWMSPSVAIVFLGLFLVFVIPMDFGAPSGPLVVIKNSVQISPNVAGPVIEVPASSDRPVSRNDILFQIDPAPYQATVDALEARLGLARLRFEQATDLAADQAGSVFEVQQYEAEARGLEADLKAANWNLDQTTVRAPSDGSIPSVVLRPGARVNAGQPVMPFIDESTRAVVVQIQQIHTRHIRPGDEAEVIFKLYPGQIFAATVVKIVRATATGQLTPVGTTTTLGSIQSDPFLVQLALEDSSVDLPAGAAGTGAIYTDQFTGLSHLFRKILLHQQNWKNYVQR